MYQNIYLKNTQLKISECILHINIFNIILLISNQKVFALLGLKYCNQL